MTDLIEEIVGDLEEDETEPEIVPEGEGFVIAGHTERESLNAKLDIETEGDATTVGGWVMENLEKIPEIGDEFEAEGLRVRVTKADDKRVLEVYAERLEEAEEDEGKDEKKDKD
jgi:CBS domain containing-hemolysin-like protein